MGNKLSKTLKTINEVNSIVNRLLNEQDEDYNKTYGAGSTMDFEEAGTDITNKLSDVASSIKGNLSKFKDTGDNSGFKAKKKTYTSMLFDSEGEGETFMIHYDGQVKDIENNDGGKLTISGNVEYEIKGYGGGQGDVLKIKKDGTNEYFLINFIKKVVNNNPNKGQIWYCKDDTCKTKGSSKSWKATSITNI